MSAFRSVQVLAHGRDSSRVLQVLPPGASRGAFLMSQLELRPGTSEEELLRELPVFALDGGVATTAEKCSICLEVGCRTGWLGTGWDCVSHISLCLRACQRRSVHRLLVRGPCAVAVQFPREQDVMRLLPRCQHSFHRGCIDGYGFARALLCPDILFGQHWMPQQASQAQLSAPLMIACLLVEAPLPLPSCGLV